MRREQLRDLLLETGLNILKEEGLGSGAERLTFKRVFDRVHVERGITVSNASVIRRIWLNNEEYQSDVLAIAVRDENETEIDATIAEAASVLQDSDLTSEAGRRIAVREICRRAGSVHALTLAESRTWHLFIGAWGYAASKPEALGDQQITDAARVTYDHLTARMEEIFAGVAQIVGLRLRPGMTLRAFTDSVTAFAEGCGLRDRLEPSRTRGLCRPNPDGGDALEWTLFATGLEALVWHYYELGDSV